MLDPEAARRRRICRHCERPVTLPFVFGGGEHGHVDCVVARLRRLDAAIAECHAQHGDDRCWMDVLPVYAAAGLPPPDAAVGDKAAMRRNCDRFVDHYCDGGGAWPSYAELEAKIARLEGRG